MKGYKMAQKENEKSPRTNSLPSNKDRLSTLLKKHSNQRIQLYSIESADSAFYDSHETSSSVRSSFNIQSKGSQSNGNREEFFRKSLDRIELEKELM
jgi:hypothetical protein